MPLRNFLRYWFVDLGWPSKITCNIIDINHWFIVVQNATNIRCCPNAKLLFFFIFLKINFKKFLCTSCLHVNRKWKYKKYAANRMSVVTTSNIILKAGVDLDMLPTDKIGGAWYSSLAVILIRTTQSWVSLKCQSLRLDSNFSAASELYI